MKRFSFVLVCALAIFALGFVVYFEVSGQQKAVEKGLFGDENDGPLSSATVSFGAWMTNPPLDRFPNDVANQFPITRNHHELIPEIARIRAGGTVNFIIGGFHVVTVYDSGTKPGDINTSLLTVPANQPAPPIIDDPNRRIYRGLDPSTIPAGAAQDRVEVVHFDAPGRYLVICSVLPHFQEGMYGYVQVLPGKNRH